MATQVLQNGRDKDAALLFDVDAIDICVDSAAIDGDKEAAGEANIDADADVDGDVDGDVDADVDAEVNVCAQRLGFC